MTGVDAGPREPATGSRRSAYFWIGCGLVAAGLAMVAFVAWELIGTNVIAHHRQERVVQQLEEDWRSPADPTAGDSSAEIGEATALVRIPRFGDDYVMPVLEGVGDDQLGSGFGHFEDTAGPGEEGNYALAAHRITHGEPLRDMPSLRPGDEVLVETRDTLYTYVLDTDPNDLVVDFEAGWVLAPHPLNPERAGVQPSADARQITLTTCAELFHSDDRMIAFGHLVSEQPT
jgi:sortase A